MSGTPWTHEDIETLTNLYPGHTAKSISLALGRSVRSIYGMAAQLSLKKSEAFFSSPASGRLDGVRGETGRFRPGLTPWNKGQPHPSRGRSAETQFKRGQDPHNTHPIGSYRLDKDGTLQQKINNDKGNNSVRWRGVHELVWVEANGPVPPKHIVVFKPGTRSNILEEITLDKVECLSLADNMRRNTLHRYPKEIVDVIRARGVLNRRINHVEKHQ